MQEALEVIFGPPSQHENAVIVNARSNMGDAFNWSQMCNVQLPYRLPGLLNGWWDASHM